MTEDGFVSRLVQVWQGSSLTWKEGYQQAPAKVCAAVEPLTFSGAAKLLVAMATDYLGAVQQRNGRRDVNDALASLRVSVARLNAIDVSLNG